MLLAWVYVAAQHQLLLAPGYKLGLIMHLHHTLHMIILKHLLLLLLLLPARWTPLAVSGPQREYVHHSMLRAPVHP